MPTCICHPKLEFVSQESKVRYLLMAPQVLQKPGPTHPQTLAAGTGGDRWAWTLQIARVFGHARPARSASPNHEVSCVETRKHRFLSSCRCCSVLDLPIADLTMMTSSPLGETHAELHPSQGPQANSQAHLRGSVAGGGAGSRCWPNNLDKVPSGVRTLVVGEPVTGLGVTDTWCCRVWRRAISVCLVECRPSGPALPE